MEEFSKSLITSQQIKYLKQYIPQIELSQIEKGPSGVRAMALDEYGVMIDDFIFETVNQNVLNVRNAPSPAATSSIAIGREIIKKMDQLFWSN